MCQCQGRKGDQGPQGVTGANGATGNTGATGPAFSLSFFEFTPAAYAGSAITETVIASAAATGTLFFWGSVTLSEESANVTIATITPNVNATPISTVSQSNIPAGNGAVYYADVPIQGSAAIVLGQAFTIEMALNSYVHTTEVVNGSVLWYIATP